MKWMNIFRGMAIGISDLVPGVSGGTIALLLGIYQRLIVAINGLFSRHWKEQIIYLIPIGLGAVIAIFLFSGIIDWLITYYPKPTFFFFTGLIVGIVPFLFQSIEYKTAYHLKHYGLLLLAFLIIVSTLFFREDGVEVIKTNLLTIDYVLLFLAGWLASSAMILPGISGSFILLLLGVYPTVTHAVRSLDFLIILIVGLGVVTGLLITSKIIHYMLIHFKVSTYAVITGFVMGAVFVVFPGLPAGLLSIFICVVMAGAGFTVSYVLGFIERGRKQT